MTHELKILKCFADAVVSGDKTFECRYNDRGYQKGDIIKFQTVSEEVLPRFITHEINDKQYEIAYVLSGFGGITDGWVVFSIKEISNEKSN